MGHRCASRPGEVTTVRGRLDARARIAAVARGGRTRLVELRSDPPVALRETGPGVVHLVGTAGGPVPGDRVRLDVEVGAGAQLVLRSVAATVALSGDPDAESRWELRGRVADGGSLSVWMEPTVAAAGCRHRADTSVALAGSAMLRWREELVFGRSGEVGGRIRTTLRVELDGSALLCQAFEADGCDPLTASPAVSAGAKALGALLAVDPRWRESPPQALVLARSAVVSPLAGPGALVTAVSDDTATLRRLLDAGLAHLDG